MKRKRSPRRRWWWLLLVIAVLVLAALLMPREPELSVVGCDALNAPGRERMACVEVTRTVSRLQNERD